MTESWHEAAHDESSASGRRWWQHRQRKAGVALLAAVGLVAATLMVLAGADAAPEDGDGNLALGKPTRTSTVEAGLEQFVGANAVDGDPQTRWSTNYLDDQWIEIDLGASHAIERVVIHWENAYARAYRLQVSDDRTTWTDLYGTADSDGGVDDLSSLSGAGRYVRLLGDERATEWGMSPWEIEVYGAPTDPGLSNVALNKPVRTSSVEVDLDRFVGAMAVDGDLDTRWSTNYADNQWIEVDLGEAHTIEQVVIQWEAAHATAYRIQVSDDQETWTDVYTTTEGDGDGDYLVGLSGQGRYVRLLGEQRATPWGVSPWEFEVHGRPAGEPPAPPTTDPGTPTTVPPTSVPPATGDTIVNALSTLCLGVQDASTEYRAPFVQAACGEGAEQRFSIEPVSEGSDVNFVRVAHTELCVAAAFPEPVAPIVQKTCNPDHGDLQWSVESAVEGGSGIVLRNAQTETCLGVAPDAVAEGDVVEQQPCDVAQAQQQWIVGGGEVTPPAPTPPPAPPGDASAAGPITNDHDPNLLLCLGAEGAATEAGAAVVQAACDGGEHQNIAFVPTAENNGFGNLRLAHSGLCLSPGGAGTGPGAAIVQVECTTEAHLLWAIAVPMNNSGRRELRNLDSKQCISTADHRGDGVAAEQFHCDPNRWQNAWSTTIGDADRFARMNERAPAVQAEAHGTQDLFSFVAGVIPADAWTYGDVAFYAPVGKVDQETANRWMGWHVAIDKMHQDLSGFQDPNVFRSVYRRGDQNYVTPGAKKVMAIVDGPGGALGNKQQAEVGMGWFGYMMQNPEDYTMHYTHFYEMNRGGADEPIEFRAIWPHNPSGSNPVYIMPHFMGGMAFWAIGDDAALEDGSSGWFLSMLDTWEREDKKYVETFDQDPNGGGLIVAMLWRILQETDYETLGQVLDNMESKPKVTDGNVAMCNFADAVNDATGGRFAERLTGPWGMPDNC